MTAPALQCRSPSESTPYQRARYVHYEHEMVVIRHAQMRCSQPVPLVVAL